MGKNILRSIAIATALTFGSTPSETHAQSSPDAIILNTQAGTQSALQDKSKETGSVLQIQSKEAAICSLGITVRDPNNVDYCDALERQKIKQEEDEEKRDHYKNIALLSAGGLAVSGLVALGFRRRKKQEEAAESLNKKDKLTTLSWDEISKTSTNGGAPDDGFNIGFSEEEEAIREFQETDIPPEWSETETGANNTEVGMNIPLNETKIVENTETITQENNRKLILDNILRNRLERGGFKIQENAETGEISILVTKESSKLLVLKIALAPMVGFRKEIQSTINPGDVYTIPPDTISATLENDLNHIKLINKNQYRTIILIKE